jgi:lysophospholipase L1-like esterase
MTRLLWLLAPVALLLLAVGAELAARWWLRRGAAYYVFPPGLRLHIRPDPESYPELERAVRFEVNRDGERGDEVPRSARGLYRILVAGGSMPECYLLDQDTSWPGALQRLLESPEHLERLAASRVHVGNVAHSGMGSEALDLVLEKVLPRYPHLQVIVILVGVSDVLHWLELGAPPQPPPPPLTSDLFRCHPEGPFGWKPRQLALAQMLTRLRRRWLRPLEMHDRAGGWMVKARAMRAQAKETLTVVPDPAPMLDHFERHLRRLVQNAKRHADRVILVRQPWLDEDYTPEEAAQMWHGAAGIPWQEEVTTYFSLSVCSRLMALLDARAAEVANALDVEQIDLMPILDRSLETYYDCFHPTPAGARAVAKAIATAILRQPLASAGARDRARPTAVA